MPFHRAVALCIAVIAPVFIVGVEAAAAQPTSESCYCNRTDPNDRLCGVMRKLDDAEVLLEVKGVPRALQLLYFTACGAGPTQKAEAPTRISRIPTKDEEFRCSGSNTFGEKLMPALVKGYGLENGYQVEGDRCNADIKLRSPLAGSGTVIFHCEAHGSETGMPALARGDADCAMMSRPPNDEEQQLMAARGIRTITSGKYETVIALDGLRIIVSPRNTVPSLSLEQIADIFAGDITDWRSVGGQPGPINLYVRDTNSGTRDTFKTLVMQPHGKQVAPGARQFESSTELVESVERDQSGIGFVGFAYGGSTRSLPIKESCGIRHEPTALSIQNEDYPLSRRLLLYSAKLRSIHSQNLIFYAISPAAQPVIKAAGYVNQTIESWGLAATKNRFAAYAAAPTEEAELDTNPKLTGAMLREMSGAVRLSISFRFRSGSDQLDTKAWQDIVQLSAFLQTPQAAGKKVILVGFADAAGSFQANKILSQNRAARVEAALRSTPGLKAPIIVKGYSELLPVSCNVSDTGRQKNRRVEVYLADE